MFYLNPINDIVFKKLFGTEVNKDLLISFLNEILGRKEENIIIDVDYTNTYNHQPSVLLKTSIVDVRCTDKIGNNYIVEMQVNQQLDYLERCHYYTACGLSLQLKEGDAYEKLLPVIFIGIVNFNLFADHDRYLSHYKLLDTEDHICRLRHEEYHFIELKKFKKQIDQLNDFSDKWIYFLRNASEYDKVPEQFSKVKYIAKAFDVLERGRWEKADLEIYEKIVDSQRVKQSELKAASEVGRKEGFKEGIAKVVKQMLEKNIDVKTISSITGLSEQEIKNLK